MRNYRDLMVWQKAHQPASSVYRVTRSFPADERFGLTSQMPRSATSIGANLAEGCGRRSDAEMARFIQIAIGSGAELSYHCLLARDLMFLQGEDYESLDEQISKVMRMLSSLSGKVKVSAAGKILGAKS